MNRPLFCLLFLFGFLLFFANDGLALNEFEEGQIMANSRPNFVKMKIDLLKKIGNFFLQKFERKLPKSSSKQSNNMVPANPGSVWNNLDDYGIFNVIRL